MLMAKIVLARSYKHQASVALLTATCYYNSPSGDVLKRDSLEGCRVSPSRTSPCVTISFVQILVSGSTGFIGSSAASFLAAQGHRVIRLLRRKSPVSATPRVEEGEGIVWDPEKGTMDPAQLEGLDGVVHLAGDPIAKGRWTLEKKARIRDSRVQGTRLLSETLARLSRPPQVLICASAIGYYGDRGSETLREESSPGRGFLPEVAVEWERASESAQRKGVRVVRLRFGIVLEPKGGALKMMLPPFKLGLGGKLGAGSQYMSWISLDDAVGVIHYTLTHPTLQGAVNAVAPQSLTNLEFTKILGRVLKRPTIFPVPAFVLRLLFGEMADETLLASTHVEPAKLLQAGYRFKHPALEGALREMLRKR